MPTNSPKMRAGVAILVAIGALTVALAVAQFVCEDDLFGETVFLISGEDTAYATGYTWKKFRSLRVGDSEERVRAELGEPLEVVEVPEGRVLVYSRSPSSTHFRSRAVRVSRGRVAEVVSEAYID
jgi:hypothetical protein